MFEKKFREFFQACLNKVKGALRRYAHFKEYKRFQDGFLHRTSKLVYKNSLEIGEGSEIKDYVILQAEQIKIGKHCQINPYTVFYGGQITVGNYVMIAPHCMIASGNHEYRNLEKPMVFCGWFTKGPIIIEDDVWIGANCTITDNVVIGKGSVIAANTCIVKNVEPYSIMSGVPGKVIGNRKTGLSNK